MSDAERAPDVDDAWLNDRSEFALNWVSGWRSPTGLQLEYRLERDPERGPMVVTDWTPREEHVGFPGVTHGGLIAAVVDDVMGRNAVLRRRWVVTARMEVRYRSAAPLGRPLRFEAWATRHRRMSMHAEARALLAGGTVVTESSGTFLPLTPELERQMVKRWPGFAEFLGREMP